MSTAVTVTFGRQTHNVSIARTVAAAMAARADLPVDRIEDVRLAVDEAVSELLDAATADAEITCRFDVDATALHIDVAARTRTARVPSTDTFGWTVLCALADSVEAVLDGDHLTLRLRVDRTVEA